MLVTDGLSPMIERNSAVYEMNNEFAASLSNALTEELVVVVPLAHSSVKTLEKLPAGM